MKVLVVDDSQAMCMILRRSLRQVGIDGMMVRVVNTGARALEMAESYDPDVILTDWNMPVMDGLALLEELKLRESRALRGVVSWDLSEDVRAVARGAGASFFLSKPFGADAVRALMEPLVEGQEVA